MNKVLLIYWPLSGNVDLSATKMADQLKAYSLTKKTIDTITTNDLKESDNWIVGGSTVGSHVWMDADDSNKWLAFFKLLNDVDLTTKTVAFFGLGDQILYPHHYVDGLGIFQEEFSKRNANIVGRWPIEGYNFYDSEGMENKEFFGLALDEDQQPELTDDRIAAWLKQISPSFR